MAILGLFIEEPSTTENIKLRLRRRYPHAAWSASIVNTTVPALVNQRLIVRVREGKKASEHFHEATDRGIAEFAQWMAESQRAPVPLRDPFLVWLENSTEADLPALLSTARRQEEIAVAEHEMAQRRLNRKRDLGNLGPADGSNWNGRVQYAILSHMAAWWDTQAQLAKNLRLNLTQGRDRHKRELGGEDA